MNTGRNFPGYDSVHGRDFCLLPHEAQNLICKLQLVSKRIHCLSESFRRGFDFLPVLLQKLVVKIL